MSLPELLSEPDWNRCQADATEALSAGRITREQLLAATRSADPQHRRRALLLLAHLPIERLDGPGALLDVLRDVCWPVREAAALFLGRFADGAVAEALARAAIRDQSPHVRAAAAQAAGTPLLPVIRSALVAPRWKVRRKAAEALSFAPSADAVPLLVAALLDADERVRASAAQSLGRMGDAARPAVVALRRRLGERSVKVVEAARTALIALGESVE